MNCTSDSSESPNGASLRLVVASSGYISSYSYLSDPSFVVARENLLKQFDRIWIDSLNGDSRETGKRTPSGQPDPSVFSTPQNRAGIRLGTAVGTFLKRLEPAAHTSVSYRNFWGTEKRQELLSSLDVIPFDGQYEVADPQPWNRLSLRPHDVDSTYLTWPKLPDLGMLQPINGLMEKRGGAFDRHRPLAPRRSNADLLRQEHRLALSRINEAPASKGRCTSQG